MHCGISLAALACLVLISNYLVAHFKIPISSAIFSILFLLVILTLNKGLPRFMKQTVDLLLKHMGLFLIPSVVMVIAYQDYFSTHAIALALVILVSTFFSFVCVLYIAHKLVGSNTSSDLND